MSAIAKYPNGDKIVARGSVMGILGIYDFDWREFLVFGVTEESLSFQIKILLVGKFIF